MLDEYSREEKLRNLKGSIVSFPDFPKPGICFRDVLIDMFDLLEDVILRKIKHFDAIIGIEARGFVIAPVLCYLFKKPFIPVRKIGKLPGKTKEEKYCLEYGENIVEIQENALLQGQRVLIVDDLIATGGSLKAACQLVQSCGATVCYCLVVMQLAELQGWKNLGNVPVISLIEY